MEEDSEHKEEAAVGSIAHILATAFKDVYEEDSKRKLARAARSAKENDLDDKGLPDTEATNDYSNIDGNEEAEAEPEPKADIEADSGPAEEDDNGITSNINIEPSVPTEEEKAGQLASYFTEFEKITLDADKLEYLESKKSNIDNNVDNMHVNAEDLVKYLQDRRAEAIDAEIVEENDLKKNGIMLGQHIPSLSSKLDVDSRVLENYGEFSKDLLVARALVQKNNETFLRRTGNLPISKLAEEKSALRGKAQARMNSAEPNYTIATATAKERMTDTKSRFNTTLENNAVTKEFKKANQKDSTGTRKIFPKQKGDQLTSEEKLTNQKILDRMNHKLNFLKNPRNDSKYINKMLVKSSKYNQISMTTTNVHETQGTAGEPTISFDMDGIGGMETQDKSASSNNSMPLFQAEPSNVSFANYEVGVKYQHKISLRNISSSSRTIAILPPKSKEFIINNIIFPTGSKSGIVAPGMSVTVILEFLPETLGNFTDVIKYETENGAAIVGLEALRLPPELTVPKSLDVGGVLVGDACRSQFKFTNVGGRGKFKIICRSDFRDEGDFEFPVEQSDKCLRTKLFTVYPCSFEVNANEDVEVVIEYSPMNIGSHTEEYLLLIDNGDVQEFNINGESRVVNLSISDINDKYLVDSKERCNANQQIIKYEKNLNFQPTVIQDEAHQEFVVANDTGLSVEFEWVWLPLHTTDAQIHRSGRKAIQANEAAAAAAAAITADITNAFDDNNQFGTVVENDAMEFSRPPTAQDLAVTMMQKTGRGEMLTNVTHTPGFPIDDNSIAEAPFTIRPCKGVISTDGNASFQVTYKPTSSSRSTGRAVMMLKNVTMASVPNPAQDKYLLQLQDNGHGDYFRLRSWFSILGKNLPLPAWRKANGEIMHTGNVMTLKTLYKLVTSFSLIAAENVIKEGTYDSFLSAVQDVKSKSDASYNPNIGDSNVDGEPSVHSTTQLVETVELEMNRVGAWIRNCVKHAIKWRRGELDEDEEEGKPQEDSQNLVEVSLYDTKQGDNIAVPIPPINLSHSMLEPVEESEDKDGDDEDDGLIVEDSQADGASAAPSHSSVAGIGSLSEFERICLNEIGIDDASALEVLGNLNNALLDFLIQHDAVEFVQEMERTTVAALGITSSGEGLVNKISCVPPIKSLGGSINIYEEWLEHFELHNKSKLMNEAIINTDEILVLVEDDKNTLILATDATTASSEMLDDESMNDLDIVSNSSDSQYNNQSNTEDNNSIVSTILSKAYYNVECDPNRVLLMPESSATLSIKVSFAKLGRFKMVIPVKSSSIPDATQCDQITLLVDVQSSVIRIETSEVNLGLIGVNKFQESTFSFINEGKACITYDLTSELYIEEEAQDDEDDEEDDGEVAEGSVVVEKAIDVDVPTVDSLASSKEIFERNVTVEFNPPSGVALPGQTMTVRLKCEAPKLPCRARGNLILKSFDDSNTMNLSTQYIRFRAEVQAPHAFLRPMSLSLGICYVNIPVAFELVLENKSNLDTDFVFERPGGESSSFRIVYDDVSGMLLPKEKKIIKCQFIALQGGYIDEVIACKVSGLLEPLGYLIAATMKGIELDFTPLQMNEATPTPFAPGGEIANLEIEPVKFGSNVSLYERVDRRIAIRNCSAIPASFNLSIRKFLVADTSASTATSTATGRKDDRILSYHESGENKFKSKEGKIRAGMTDNRALDNKFLTSGLGAAYSIVGRSTGKIEPWGVVIVKLRAYNNMPGAYDDELVFNILDSSVSRKYSVPLKMTVEGCPFYIDNSSVGLSAYKGKVASFTGKQLSFGSSCVNAEEITREFTVVNNASSAGRIKWSTRSGIKEVRNGPIKFSINIADRFGNENNNENGDKPLVKTGIRFWDDINNNIPFEIEPKSLTIPPFGKSKFKVTMAKGLEVTSNSAVLSGRINIIELDDGSSGSLTSSTMMKNQNSQSQVSLTSQKSQRTLSRNSSSILSKPKKGYVLDLYAFGQFKLPTLKINDEPYTAYDEIRLMQDDDGIQLTGDIPTLFGQESSGMDIGDVYRKTLTIENPLDTHLVFTMSTDGPFNMSRITKAVSFEGVDNNTMQSKTKSSTFSKGSSVGQSVRLLPQQSESFSIAFTPKKNLRNSLKSTSQADALSGKNESGNLYIKFSSGQGLQIPVSMKLSAPFITASTSKIHFGRCHTSTSANGFFLLSNLTPINAKWTITHIPAKLDAKGAIAKTSSIRVKGFLESAAQYDDPSVFMLHPSDGILEGPTLSVASSIAAPPSDVNRIKESLIISQKLTKTSWMTGKLNVMDHINDRHNTHIDNEANSIYPLPIKIEFKPKSNIRYRSRFRFVCEYGNNFDIICEGSGTYEEHEHDPKSPAP